MMSALCLFFVLLSLLSVSGAALTPQDCSQLVKPTTLEERSKIFGRWILIEAFTRNLFLDQYLKSHDSFWGQLAAYEDDKDVGVSIHGQIEGECYGYTSNATFINDNTFTDQVASFFQTSSDCLLVNIKVNTFKALLVFGRGASLSEADLKTVREQAKCLKYRRAAVFSYDINKELCPDKPGTIEMPFEF